MHLFDQTAILVDGVGLDLLETGHGFNHSLQNRLGTMIILNLSRVHGYFQQTTDCVHDNASLAPIDPLECEAPLSISFGGLGTLCVNDTCTRIRISTTFLTIQLAQGRVDLFPGTTRARFSGLTRKRS